MVTAVFAYSGEYYSGECVYRGECVTVVCDYSDVGGTVVCAYSGNCVVKPVAMIIVVSVGWGH